MTFRELRATGSFTRADYLSAIKEEKKHVSEGAMAYRLREDTEKGKIIHIGRDLYAFPVDKQFYSHSYSEESHIAVNEIQTEFPDALFQVFELTQLNSFVNHLFAHNTIFISVENELVDYVFDSLRRKYPGRVMLKPSPDNYYRYLVEDQIVINRLPSEAPQNSTKTWQSRLEKILVDIAVDKLLTRIVSPNELETIVKDAFDRYYLDIRTMYRYARRRGASEKFKLLLNKYVPVETEEKE